MKTLDGDLPKMFLGMRFENNGFKLASICLKSGAVDGGVFTCAKPDGDSLAEGLIEGLSLGLTLGEALGLTEGLSLAEGETLGLSDALGEIEGLSDAEGLTDGDSLALGDSLAEGDNDADSVTISPPPKSSRVSSASKASPIFPPKYVLSSPDVITCQSEPFILAKTKISPSDKRLMPRALITADDGDEPYERSISATVVDQEPPSILYTQNRK